MRDPEFMNPDKSLVTAYFKELHIRSCLKDTSMIQISFKQLMKLLEKY